MTYWFVLIILRIWKRCDLLIFSVLIVIIIDLIKKFSSDYIKKRFEDLDSFVINKKVILRVDLNLPSFEGEIVDFTRLEKISHN